MPEPRPDISSYWPRVWLPLAVLAIIALGAALFVLKTVLLPFIVALFLSSLFRPLVVWLRRHGVPMPVILILVLVVVGGLLLSVTLIAISSVDSLVAALPRYEARWNNDLLPGLEHLLTKAPEALQQQVRDLQWSNVVQVGSLLALLYAGAGSFVNLLSGLALILLIMLFILGSEGLFARKVEIAYEPSRAKQIASILREISSGIERYFVTVSLMNLVSGAISAIVLSIFGVDFALLWGLLTFLVTFIPTIGSIFAMILPILVAFLQFGSIGPTLEVGAVLVLLEFLWGSVITPRLMGSSLDLSPLLVMLALIFWGWLWGPWGMILSVPITSMLKIIFEAIPGTKPIAVLMSSGAKSARATKRQ